MTHSTGGGPNLLPHIDFGENPIKELQMIETSCFYLAERFVGLKEVPGTTSNPAILAMLQLDAKWPQDDEVPWCSAFTNFIAWMLRLPRSKSLRARSWLGVGTPVSLSEASPRLNDLVILSRGINSPGPEVLDAPGHVGFFGKQEHTLVWLLGGNQGNSVSLAPFAVDRVLGVRRLIS